MDVDQLLERGQELLQACKIHDLDAIEKALTGAAWVQEPETGFTSLHYAAGMFRLSLSGSCRNHFILFRMG